MSFLEEFFIVSGFGGTMCCSGPYDIILYVIMGYISKPDLTWDNLDFWRKRKGFYNFNIYHSTYSICWWVVSEKPLKSKLQTKGTEDEISASPCCETTLLQKFQRDTHRWLISPNCTVINWDTEVLEIVQKETVCQDGWRGHGSIYPPLIPLDQLVNQTSPPIAPLLPLISPVLNAISLSGCYLRRLLPDTDARRLSVIFTQTERESKRKREDR